VNITCGETASTRTVPRAAPAPDLVERVFTADRPNRFWVADAIDGWYNTQRIQKKLGGRSPDEFEASYHLPVPVGT
jgi:hypothetical protein